MQESSSNSPENASPNQIQSVYFAAVKMQHLIENGAKFDGWRRKRYIGNNKFSLLQKKGNYSWTIEREKDVHDFTTVQFNSKEFHEWGMIDKTEVVSVNSQGTIGYFTRSEQTYENNLVSGHIKSYSDNDKISDLKPSVCDEVVNSMQEIIDSADTTGRRLYWLRHLIDLVPIHM